MKRQSCLKSLLRTIAGTLAIANVAAQLHAEVQTAGTLLVNIDPSSLPAGPASWVTNSGSLGGVFEATGITVADQQPVIVNAVGGAKGIMFDGQNYMQHVAAPGGATVNLSATPLAGVNVPCSIECWVINPTTRNGDGDTMVYWGMRGSAGNHSAFAYSSSNYGALDHWGGPNVGWNPVPPMGVWHHLVYTYDGTTMRLYTDGALQSSTIQNVSFNPVATKPILLAAQRNSDGSLVGAGGVRGGLTLGKVRIHTGVLSEAQIANNYNYEKASFVATPAPLRNKPIHRYTFNNPVSGDAVGQTVEDVGTASGQAAVIQGTAGTATFTGTKLTLAGGSSASAPYVDLPNGLISSLSSSNGGSGKVTVEGWVTVTGSRTWPRLFDFGGTTVGELTAPGGSGNGQNYFMLAQVNTYRDWGTCEVSNNGYNGGPNAASNRGFKMDNDDAVNGLTHYAVTWDEPTGEVIVYLNGLEATRFTTSTKLNQIDDANAWLGRSVWTGDMNLQGSYDEFRVYNYVLSAAEVQNDYQVGPDTVFVEPGALQAVHLQVPRATTMAGTFEQVTVSADYANVPNVPVTTKPGIVYTSSDTNILTVSAAGFVRAVGEGTATVTVNFQGQTDTQTVTVTPLTASLVHRYSFANDASDSIAGADAVNTAVIDGSGQVSFLGDGGFVQLPAGILSGMDAVTIETWASFGANPANVWLWGFGAQNSTQAGMKYVFCTPHTTSSATRIAITQSDPGWTGEQGANYGQVLDGQTNVHVVAVFHPYAGYAALYLNGKLASINTNVTIPLSAVLSDFNTIGKSLYTGDPSFTGSVDEFRIYNGPLTADKIAINKVAGPDTLISDPGALQAVHLNLPTNQIPQLASIQATFTGDFANISGVDLFASGGAVFSSSNTNVVTVTPDGAIKAVTPGTATVTASYGGRSASSTIQVLVLPAVLSHRYTFDGLEPIMVPDSLNPNDATLNAQLAEDAYLLGNGQVKLNEYGAGGYVRLPNTLFNGAFAVTIETWATFDPSLQANTWIYGFGDTDSATGNGRNYLFLSANNGGQIATGINPGTGEQNATALATLAGRTNMHIAAVYHPFAGYEQLYVNGYLVGYNSNLTAKLSDIKDTASYIGKSLFTTYPSLTATVDEFRVYNGALTPAQIALDAAAGPNTIITNPGSLKSIRLSVTNQMALYLTQQASLLGTFANVANVNLFSYTNTTVTSDNSKVVTISPSGLITAVGVGSANVTAIAGGMTNSQKITVSAPATVLTHRYSFTSDASDSVNPGAGDGYLPNGGTYTNGQLALDAASMQYVQLPAGIISNYYALTVETWASFGSISNNSWLFGFGNTDSAGAGANYVFCTPHGSAARIAITASDPGWSGSGEQQAVSPRTFDNLTNAHIVAVIHPLAGYELLYLNGALIASNMYVTIQLSSVMDLYSYIGKSLYNGDPYFSFSLDEFRIYNGALTPSQVALDTAVGPTLLGNANALGALKTVRVVANSSMLVDQSQQVQVLGDFVNMSGVNMFLYTNTVLTSSDTNVFTVTGTSGQIRAVGTGTATLTVTAGSSTYVGTITVNAGPSAQLKHRYSFSDAVGSTTVADSVGSANGTVYGGGTFKGTSLSLDGTSGYVALPAGIVSSMTNATFEAWVTINTVRDWQRIFDFGDQVAAGTSASTSIFLTTKRGGASGPRFATETNSADTMSVDGAAGLVAGTPYHLVVTYNAAAGVATLYVNGAVAGYNNINLPLNAIIDTNAWLGRSQWPDPYFNGSFDEFRIYEGCLTPASVSSSYLAGPNAKPGTVVTPASIAVAVNGSKVTLSWPADHLGWVLQAQTNTLSQGIGNNWVDVTGSATATQTTIDLTPSNEAVFYRLRNP